MILLIASLSVLFVASMVVYVAIRIQTHPWPPPGFPPVPNSLWFSTVVILSASVTIQMALSAVRRDDEKGLTRYLWMTLFVGVAFLCLQTFNWMEFYGGIRSDADAAGGGVSGDVFHSDGPACGARRRRLDSAGGRDHAGEAGPLFAQLPSGCALYHHLLAFSGCDLGGAVSADLFLIAGRRGHQSMPLRSSGSARIKCGSCPPIVA